ncbi:hypothetical protein SDC9_106528 [bioreactor metagenome]|uniref:Uncharacterized protein n=1 Tax=bioreactor metagenome TaxID=1076179 RepID=A0A645B2K9_9ZZZZ
MYAEEVQALLEIDHQLLKLERTAEHGAYFAQRVERTLHSHPLCCLEATDLVSDERSGSSGKHRLGLAAEIAFHACLILDHRKILVPTMHRTAFACSGIKGTVEPENHLMVVTKAHQTQQVLNGQSLRRGCIAWQLVQTRSIADMGIATA